ncbi:nudix hydrolase 11-like [Xenia sp. Carnegie-2017]|uniref:nudix hydrolase 11-like n=1 Tax=Xenia sp. Carnegie-2017 TaxID=2897299 RepID=UPI001F036346|nr:nudix hydrolase 11-like [Xenia sp. Carnegie-2017]
MEAKLWPHFSFYLRRQFPNAPPFDGCPFIVSQIENVTKHLTFLCLQKIMWSFTRLEAYLEHISTIYSSSDYKNCESLKEAAVLVPITIKNRVPYVLCTVRSYNLSSYPGQVSFPGGKRDKQDVDITASALRETLEEIGLSSKNLRIIGKMLPYVTQTGYLVTPVVAEVLNYESFTPDLNPLEVTEILLVPLETFLLQKYHKRTEFLMKEKIDYFEFGEGNENIHIIFGLTAVIATHVACLLFARLPEFKYRQWINDTTGFDKDKIYNELIQPSKL